MPISKLARFLECLWPMYGTRIETTIGELMEFIDKIIDEKSANSTSFEFSGPEDSKWQIRMISGKMSSWQELLEKCGYKFKSGKMVALLSWSELARRYNGSRKQL